MARENVIFIHVSCLQGLSNDGPVGMARAAVYQEIWPWAGFKTSDVVKEMLGGATTVEQL